MTAANADVAAYFDADHAAIYDRRIRRRCPSYDALHEMVAGWLASRPEGGRLLSAGAGTGAEILSLGPRFPGWSFVAADLSADMLAACRRRVEAAGLAGRVDYHHGPLQGLPVGAEFDAATSILVSHFILDRGERLAYYRAIAERLRPGGLFLLADLHGDPADPAFARLFEPWLATFTDAAADPAGVAWERTHLMGDIAFIPEAELAALLEEAGFEPPLRFYQSWLFGGWATARRSA